MRARNPTAPANCTTNRVSGVVKLDDTDIAMAATPSPDSRVLDQAWFARVKTGLSGVNFLAFLKADSRPYSNYYKGIENPGSRSNAALFRGLCNHQHNANKDNQVCWVDALVLQGKPIACRSSDICERNCAFHAYGSGVLVPTLRLR